MSTYFPYLHCRQYDLQVLRDIDQSVFLNNVTPIIEPISLNTACNNLYISIVERNIPFIFISNPIHGNLINSHNEIRREIINNIFNEYNNYTLGFIISTNTTIAQIRSFLQSHSGVPKCLIFYTEFQRTEELNQLISDSNNFVSNIFIDGHVSNNYHNSFEDTRSILIRDGFSRRQRNADYPPNEFFSDLHLSYNHLGFEGFGDFTITGETFGRGGAAHAVAIHMTYINAQRENAIWIRHFLSDDREETVNPGGKFLQALAHLMRHQRSHHTFVNTTGLQEYNILHNSEEFHGLGLPKKLSMIHHIETINSLL